MPSLTKEEIDALMQENLEKIRALSLSLEAKIREAVQAESSKDNQAFTAFRQAYKIYNATNLPILPRGTEILLDLRGGNSSGVVACYKSLGDRYVEAWVKTI